MAIKKHPECFCSRDIVIHFSPFYLYITKRYYNEISEIERLKKNKINLS